MDNAVKTIVAKNLIELRKSRNYTQSDLAELLNYSDKTISKWENGDSLPDISVLYALTQIYGISLDDLVHENATEKLNGRAEEKKLHSWQNRLIILCLSVSVVFLIASLVFVYLKLKADINYWEAFVWAVPASCVALLYFNRKTDKEEALGGRVYRTIVLSVLCWSLLLAVYLQFLSYQLWLIFVIGIPIEAIVWLGSRFHK